MNAFQPQVLRVGEVFGVKTEGVIGTRDICRELECAILGESRDSDDDESRRLWRW